VYAASQLTTSVPVGTSRDKDFAVVKLDGATGAELWRREIDHGVIDQAHAVSLDGDGDVLAGGEFRSGAESKFALIRLAAANGTEHWRHVEATVGRSFLADIAVDAANDVYGAGYFGKADSLESFFGVVKFEGALGVEQWRFVEEANSGLRLGRGLREELQCRGRYPDRPPQDGSLSFWHGEQTLLATAFPEEHGVQQGEVVANKRLSEVMDFIQERQRERTEARIAKPSTTLRRARLLRAGAHRRTAPGFSAEDRP
jgi:hypothetical protein